MASRRTFPLFRSNVDLAHAFLRQVVRAGDEVFDGTAGNGHDTALLAQLVAPSSITDEASGRVYSCDIQPEAISSSQRYCSGILSPAQYKCIRWFSQCHSLVPKLMCCPRGLRAAVFNLGYLPGNPSRRHIITRPESTIASIAALLPRLSPGGLLLVSAYRGHPGGSEETQALTTFFQSLESSPVRSGAGDALSVSQHMWPARPLSPLLFMVQRSDAATAATTASNPTATATATTTSTTTVAAAERSSS